MPWKPNKPIRLRVKSDMRVKALKPALEALTKRAVAYNEVVESFAQEIAAKAD